MLTSKKRRLPFLLLLHRIEEEEEDAQVKFSMTTQPSPSTSSSKRRQEENLSPPSNPLSLPRIPKFWTPQKHRVVTMSPNSKLWLPCHKIRQNDQLTLLSTHNTKMRRLNQYLLTFKLFYTLWITLFYSLVLKYFKFILTYTKYYYTFYLQKYLRLLHVKCQIKSLGVKLSDFISLISSILSLGLLFSIPQPGMSLIITSNVIHPMDSGVTVSGIGSFESLHSLDGVIGKRVELPCGITPRSRDDTVYMVLWFRGEESLPIYSLDVRGKPFSGAKHWSAEIPFGKRAHFRTVSDPAKLVIEDLVISDGGMYRCRVDFRNSPSRETRLNLTITVPPEEPLIFESTGLSLRGEVGPYREGSTLELTCIVRGGSPNPLVYWYLNEELIDSSYHVEAEREVMNHISVPNISRNHHRAHLICRASNTLLLPPVSKTVIIEINLRPLTVAILHRHSQLSTDTQYEITCESWGSHPQSLITWWLDNHELKGARTEDSRASNMSLSKLMMVPNASIDGQLLMCRVENPLLPGSAIEDSWRLKVVYAPILSLRMGSSLNPNDIKEGDDVFFDCLIKANPPVLKLSWFQNGELLYHNRSAGVILSNQSLVLQKVSRPSGGNYTCRSINQQGVGTSNQVQLGIMYAPTCQSGLSSTDEVPQNPAVIIAASRSEDVNITCEMKALPSNLKFQWSHTNSVGESSDILPETYTTSGSKSFLRYRVRSEEDFGTVLCWATNLIGTAERPCIYQLVPADIPQAVENCTISNRTSTSAEINCESGFDGGLPQIFILEAYQSTPFGRRGLQFNVSSTNPMFTLSGLDADGMFQFRIYAVNRKGRSSPIIMDGIALHYPAMQSAKAQEFRKTTIAIIVGAVSAVMVTFIALIAFVVHRRMHPITMMSSIDMDKTYRRSSRGSSSTQDELYHHATGKKMSDSFAETHFSQTGDYDRSSAGGEDDGDPDLIPSKNVKMGPGVVKMYSRMSNGEINQRHQGVVSLGEVPPSPRSTFSMEKFPLRAGIGTDLDPSLRESTPLAMSGYATLRGTTLNGFGLNKRGETPVETSTIYGSLHGKPSSMVVSIDSRLIGQQLASSQLPESCV